MEIIKFNEITPTKSNIDKVVKQIITPIKEGNINKMEFIVKAKFLQKVLDTIINYIDIDIEKKKECLGATIEPFESNIKYDYIRYNDESNHRLEIISIEPNKILYKNVSNNILNVSLKIYYRLLTYDGENSRQILYSTNVTLHPNVVYYSINESDIPNKEFYFEGKDLYIEHKMN
jgi:hypothetical protein